MKILNVIGIVAMAVGAVKVLCLSIPLFKSDMPQLSQLAQYSTQVYNALILIISGLFLMIFSRIDFWDFKKKDETESITYHD